MRFSFIPLFILFLASLVPKKLKCQTRADSISVTWTKYIVVNDTGAVMIVYDDYFNDWELEGAGYEGPLTMKNLMDSVAAFHGFTYDGYRLGGIFTYHKPDRYRSVIKPYYVVTFDEYSNGMSFRDTSRVKWVSFEEAKKMIPYPTMVLILDQLLSRPETVWGGAFEEYNYLPPGNIRWKIIEPFYKLSE